MPAHHDAHREIQGKIHFVDLLTTDIDGLLKGMTVPISPIETVASLIDGSVQVPSCGIDGSSIKGLASVSDSDLRLVPDLTSIRELPGSVPRRACVFADVYQRDSTGQLQPHPLSPRIILRRMVDELVVKKLMVRVKLEPEFYYITETGDPLDNATYADLFPHNQGSDLLLETALDLRAAGIEARWLHHEVGNGQQEIELDFVDISQAADNLTLFKLLVRRRAAELGVDVTFMAKPFPNMAGSGLHCHLQLWQANRNLLGTADGNLSDTGFQFVAGLLIHTPAITAIANPSINSYKRLVPDFEAPVHIAWGYRNRSALIRVPLFTKSEDAAIEFRSPDPLTNPYLLLPTLVGAGLDGIHRELQPPAPVAANLHHFTPKQLVKQKIPPVPESLEKALRALKQDAVIQSLLGEEFCVKYHEFRAADWHEYTRTYITDFEWERYLHR